MRFLKLSLLVGGFLLLSGSSFAIEEWRRGPSVVGATTPDPPCTRGITAGATCYWSFNNSIDNSPAIVISAEYASLVYDPNIAAGGTGGSTVRLMWVVSPACTGSQTVVTGAGAVAFEQPVAVITLNGLPDTGGAQFLNIPPGCYFIDVVATATAVDAVVMITGAVSPSQ